MAFKKIPPPAAVPESPDKLLLQLPRRKIPDVLPHQKEIMRAYAHDAADKEDVALELPTGSGKTLVGLLLAEWLRRKNGERVVYLCPTRQLVNQVSEQAEEKYGLSVLRFVGRKAEYNPRDKAEYRSADKVAVTTYSSLFNTNPFFDDADVVIVDDAHAAENYIGSFWSILVDLYNQRHQPLHAAMRALLEPHIDPMDAPRLAGSVKNSFDIGWVELLPASHLRAISAEFASVMDAHAEAAGLYHSWSVLREHIHACQLYYTSHEFYLRPLLPPTWTHQPFSKPRQRIYMSATLGSGGDLERLLGRRSIFRIPVPEGWDRQGVGRRFFMFPEMSLDETDTGKLRCELLRLAGRGLVLVPSDKAADKVELEVTQALGIPVFRADAIEISKKPFVESPKAVAVFANRYDGIDFPGSECRLLFVEGLPKATNPQERFLMSRMAAGVLFNERVQTRILQAIGRCTRSLEDFSAVVVTGDESTRYLADAKRWRYFHPELQGEVRFGVEQSKESAYIDFVENFSLFLRNESEWEAVNESIIAYRDSALRETFPAIAELEQSVFHEIRFQEALWQGDYNAALDAAASVLGSLNAPELRGYRAQWHYLAGSAAELGGVNSKAKTHYRAAQKAATSIRWLVSLAAAKEAEEAAPEAEDTSVLGQVERVEAMLLGLGTVHDRKFAQKEREILEGLIGGDSKQFEHVHEALGALLGFEAGNSNEEGAPDPWWFDGEYCIVFEDYTEAKPTSSLDTTKARQAASHPNWIRDHVSGASHLNIVPVLLTSVTKADVGARPHLRDLKFWPLDQFRDWGRHALTVIRSLRRTLTDGGDLVWRADAATALKEAGLDMRSIVAVLQKAPASEFLH